MVGLASLPNEPTIEARTFWRAVGQRATGSTMVTARSFEGPAGFLSLSATHVCADPPLMLVSIDKRTLALTTILAAKHFVINYLPKNAVSLVDIFNGKTPQTGAARFEEGNGKRRAPAPQFSSTPLARLNAAWKKRLSEMEFSSRSVASSMFIKEMMVLR
jgi:flavin reductase (DIM6/NTAB) family NADH-FMN oxidoreductase RutF